MRVVNDKQEKTEPSELGFFSIAAYAILSAFGIASVILGPLPMILAHVRLADPWPKVTALLGAVIAVTFLEVPLPLVMMTFVLGLFIADGVWKETGLWALVRNASLAAAVLALLLLTVLAQVEKTTPAAYWSSLVGSVIGQLQTALKPDGDFKWDVMKAKLLYQGPFLYLSAVILSLWFSVGIAAHLGWFESGHRFSADSLRELRLPAWITLPGFALYLATFAGGAAAHPVLGGLAQIFGALLLIQGLVCLSVGLARFAVPSRARTLIYVVSIVVGFYILIGAGALGPVLLSSSFRTKKLEEIK